LETQVTLADVRAAVGVAKVRFLRFVTQAVAIVCAAFFGAGCTLKYDAKMMFAEAYSCPSNRITVEERPDLYHYVVVPGYEPPYDPPLDVQSDPERLAMYRAKRESQRVPARTVLFETGFLYEINGCGHKVIWECSRDTRRLCTYPKRP
jgi:hypothetical protein